MTLLLKTEGCSRSGILSWIRSVDETGFGLSLGDPGLQVIVASGLDYPCLGETKGADDLRGSRAFRGLGAYATVMEACRSLLSLPSISPLDVSCVVSQVQNG